MISISMNNKQLPECLAKLEGYVRQFYELTEIESKLREALTVPSVDETAAQMAVRIAAEREIHARKDYLSEFITLSVVEEFKECGMLSKCPELHTSRNEK